MKEATAQEKIQALITPYKNGQKKPSESDNVVIKMLEPLLTKNYSAEPTKHLNAVIADLSAILKIKYTQTFSRKGLKKVSTLAPIVGGGDITPGIHGDIEALVAELRGKLDAITNPVAAPAPNNNAAELAEAKRQVEEANRRAAEALAEKAKADVAAAEAKRRAAETEAALAAEKTKKQQPVTNPQTEAALAEAKKQAEAAATALKAEKKARRAAQKEAKAKEKAAQEAQVQLKAKEAEATEAKAAVAKTQTEFQQYRDGEEQRLQQATIDGATQVIRRVAQVVSTNEVMLLAITQGFGGMQQFTTALITGNTTVHANGNGQLANSNHQQPVATVVRDPAPNGNHQQVLSETEAKKYKENLGEARFKIILKLLALFEAAKNKNEQLMIRYFICQLALHVNDKSIRDTAKETSALFHNKKLLLAKDYPEFHGFLKSLSEEPQDENELTNALLTQTQCSFMAKRLNDKPENGVLFLPTDKDGVKLFSDYFKEVKAGRQTIPPKVENTYRDAITGALDYPRPSSPVTGRKENAVAATAAPSHLTEVQLNQQFNL